MTLKKLAVALAGGALVFAGVVNAATDGSLSETESVGVFDITLTVREQVKIWGLADYEFSGLPDKSASESKNICIYSNSTAGFNADVDTTNSFKLKSGDVIATDYTLTLALNDSNTSEISETWNGSATKDFNASSGSLLISDTCDETNANVELTISLSNINGATISGDYSDTVTITVSPN